MNWIQTHRIAVAIAVFAYFTTAGNASDDERVLFDFDGSSRLSADWSAVGQITVRRETLPGSDQAGPEKKGVTIETDGRAGIFSAVGTVPKDWASFGLISCWVYRSRAEAATRPESVMEIQAYQTGGKARFWRKVELNHTGWKEVSVPLRWFRWGEGIRPRWDQIDRIGFWLRDAAGMSIDTIAVRTGDSQAAYFSLSDLRNAAFPGDESVRMTETDDVAVLTNEATLDTELLTGHLGELATTIRSDFPFLEPAVRKPMLVVFRTRPEYENFMPRFARLFNSTGSKPQSAGFTFHGIATSCWEEKFGTLRPTYTHEFVHSFVAQTARLPNRTEWVHEGIASLYQIRLHPQADIRQIVQDGIEQEEFRTPLPQLCNGERIPSNRYWQALTLMEMLSTTESYRKQLPSLFQAFRNANSTNLAPHLESVLKSNWNDLTVDWSEFCRTTYLAE